MTNDTRNGRKRKTSSNRGRGSRGRGDAPAPKLGRPTNSSTSKSRTPPALIMNEAAWNRTSELYADVTAALMLVNGDGDKPLQKCRELMLGVMRDQLILFVHRCREYAESAGRQKASLEDVAFCFRRHRLLAARLMAYVKIAANIRSINAQASSGTLAALVTEDSSENNNNNKEEADSDEEEESKRSKTRQRKRTALSNLEEESDEDSGEEDEKDKEDIVARVSITSQAVKICNSLEEAFDKIEELSTAVLETVFDADPERLARSRRMASRVARHDSYWYSQFAEARRRTFVSSIRRNDSEILLLWLGVNGAVENDVAFILNWIAREVIAEVTDSAYIIACTEQKGLFRNVGSQGTLQLRHYEEALRRNYGFRHRGDLLFGYY